MKILKSLKLIKPLAKSLIKPLKALNPLFLILSIYIALFNPNLIVNKIKARIYIIFNFIKHLLFKNNLLNNYNIIYLINNIIRFNKGSFIKLLIINIIKGNITLFLILKYSTYIFKGLLNKGEGKKVDFILFNIAIIKGFLINIILKALFYKEGL
jgi:hypothetical protein